MTKKIMKLTPEQEALMEVYRDRYIEIGHGTKTDKAKAEAAIKSAYKCAGLKPPKEIMWCSSPLSQSLVYVALKEGPASVWDSVRASVRASVWDSVWDSVRDSVRASVRASVWDSVRASVRASVWDSVRASVWASVGDSVRASVWDSVRGWYNQVVEGNHLAHWGAWHAYWTDAVGLNLHVGNGMAEMIRECGWVYCAREIALVCPKPSVCKTRKNARGRFVLHAEGEPAIRYEDGFEIWSYDGVRLTDSKLHCHPSQWQAKWVVEETNADLRTTLLKGIGYERFVNELGGTVVNEQTMFDGLPYQLIDMPDVGAGPMRFLKMKNPSVEGLIHIEPVAPHSWIKTCEDAMNWRLGAEGPDEKMEVLFTA